MCKEIDKNELLQLYSQTVENYISACLTYLNLPIQSITIKPLDPDDKATKTFFDSKRKLHHGQKNPGYYGYFYNTNTLIYDLEDIHKHESQNKSGEWKYKVLHEVRHAYQHIQVDNLKSGIQTHEKVEVIRDWEADFDNKKVATTSNITEIDANDYSLRNWNIIPPSKLRSKTQGTAQGGN